MSRSSSRHRREIQGIDSAGQYPPEFGEVPNDQPLTPAPSGLLWDFIEKLSLGPFSSDDHRDSVATGPDNDGIIQQVGVNVPVFPGARVVTNTVSQDIGSWANYDCTVDGTLVTPLTTNARVGAEIKPESEDFPPGATHVRLTGYAWADTPHTMQFRVFWRSVSGNVSIPIDVDTDRKRYTTQAIPIPEGATAVVFAFYPDLSYVLPCNIELPTAEVAAVADFIPGEPIPQGTQWLDTTNANTVDAGTGIVTENPGVPIEGIKGLQLEGEREDYIAESSDFETTWTVEGTAVIVSTDNPAPDGSNTATNITSTTGGPNRLRYSNLGVYSGDVVFSILLQKGLLPDVCIRIVEFNGLDAILDYDFDTDDLTFGGDLATDGGSIVDFAEGFVLLWVTGTAAGVSQIAATVGGAILGSDGNTDCIIWDAGFERDKFPSSRILTAGSAVTRAPTKAIAPFTSIPELDDEGLDDNFSFQVVAVLAASVSEQNSARLLVLHSQATGTSGVNSLQICLSSNSGGRLQVVLYKDVGSVAKYFDIPGDVDQDAGGVLDIRGRYASASGLSLWSGSVPIVIDDAEFDYVFADAIKTVYLGTRYADVTANEAFIRGQIVRFVPEALSDAEIEAW